MKKALVFKQIDQLCAHQLIKLTLCAGPSARPVQDYLGLGCGWRAQIAYAEERKPFDTIWVTRYPHDLSKVPFSS